MLLLIEELLQTISNHSIKKLSYDYHDDYDKPHVENTKQEIIWFKQLAAHYYPLLLDKEHESEHGKIKINYFAYGRFGWYVDYLNGKNRASVNLDRFE